MKRKLQYTFVIWLSMLLPLVAWGQYCQQSGGFVVSPQKGCAPLQVNLQSQVAGAVNVAYAYEFDKTSMDPPVESRLTEDQAHTYLKGGLYTIVQVGSAQGTGFHYCNDVEVYETAPPEAYLTTCPDGRARITILSVAATLAYDGLEVDWGDGSAKSLWKPGDPLLLEHRYTVALPTITVRGRYQDGRCSTELKALVFDKNNPAPSLEAIRIRKLSMQSDGTVEISFVGMDEIETSLWMDQGNGLFADTGLKRKGSGVHVVSVLNLDPTRPYRFRLISKDICGNPIQSAIVSSFVLQEGLLSVDESVALTWTGLPQTDKVLQYQLKRDGKDIFSSPDKRSYVDNDVDCGQAYRYELVATMQNNVESSFRYLEAVPNASAPERISAAVVSTTGPESVATEVSLSGVGLTSTYNIQIERAIMGESNFTMISPSKNQNLQFSDKAVNTGSKSYCYRFTYQNSCKLSSPPSAPVCTVLLNSVGDGLSWSKDLPFLENLGSYELEVMDASMQTVMRIPKGSARSHILSLNDPAASESFFRVKATGLGGQVTSYSNVIQFTRNPIIQVPDVFTPNGDGLNESFEVKVYFAQSYRLSIYDRWGAIVYRGEGASANWDGRNKGQLLAEGHYGYVLEVHSKEGESIVRKGTLLLLR